MDRPASFLPTIKCSSCAQDIAISLMGEHICGRAPSPPAFDDYTYSYSTYSSYSTYKDDRRPPQVDTSAANTSFLRDQLTPISASSGSRSVSPKTPVGRSFLERPGPGPRSGEASPNSSLGSPMHSKAPASLLQRMDTIAPGPFDIDRRPSAPSLPTRSDDFEAPSFGPVGRAGTFPRASSHAHSAHSAHSARQLSVSSRGSHGSRTSNGSGPSGPDTSRAPPPRTSLVYRNSAGTGGNVPQINLADEFGIGNPYHAPSESMSSTVSSLSTFSDSHNHSQNHNHRQNHESGSLARPLPLSSSTSSFSSAFSGSSLGGVSASSSMNSLSGLPEQTAETQAAKAKPAADLDALLNDLQTMSTTDTHNARRPSQAPVSPVSPLSVKSQPASQERRPSNVSQVSDTSNNGFYTHAAYSNSYSSLGRASPAPPSTTPPPALARSATAPIAAVAAVAAPRVAPRVAPLASSRGNCKACRLPITGKSVSSADGRLTGRFHKACFVCTTCAAPFASATFYVHADRPYCERHYHEVNGSLCGTCGNGIEGQYLADENECKHHRTCLVCADCRQPLEDGYFEVAGRVYCERDAWRRQPPAPAPSPLQQQFGPPQSYMAQQQQQPQLQNQQPQQQKYRQNLGVPRGLPAGPGVARRPSNATTPLGMSTMNTGVNMNMSGFVRPPYGRPPQKAASNSNSGYGGMGPPRMRMEKRMTRLGMI